MPITQTREIAAASRLDNMRYAIRDLVGLAEEVTKKGHKVLPLNIGDPNVFDFQTPPHMIEAVYKAMRDGKNGYAPSSGIKEALDAIPRSKRGDCSPNTQRTASEMFDLPHQFGQTMAVTPRSKGRSTDPANDLKPTNSSRLNLMGSDPFG